MQFIKADTAIKVIIGPVVDVTDGYTPVTALSLATADEAEIMKHDASVVTSIAGNTFAAIAAMDGYYNLTLSAAQLDTEGLLTVGINDDSLCRPVRADFMVVNANVFDSLFAAQATGYLQVDAVQISGDAVAADNLESQFDETGLLGDTFPASQAQAGKIATGTAAVSVVASGQLLTTGSEVNSYLSTTTKNNIYHQISDAAGAIEIYYEFEIGGTAIATEVSMWGRLTGGNDSLNIYAYNWINSSWDQIGTLGGTGSSNDSFSSFNLLNQHTGLSANIGLVRVRGFAASGLTTAVLYIDQAYVSFAVVSQSAGYANGAVWIDTSTGVAGIEPYVNGVADNPSNTLANAVTIGLALKLRRYQLANDSSITLVSPAKNQEYIGTGWVLDLGDQDISFSTFNGASLVSGTATTPAGEAHFVGCELSALIIGQSHFLQCGFTDTISLTAASTYTFVDCYSQVVGGGATIMDFGAAVGDTGVNMRRFSGSIEVQNMGQLGSDALAIEGFGSLTVNANCIGGVIEVRGAFAVTDNSGGAITFIYDSIRTDVADVLTDTNELQVDWVDGGRLDLLLDRLITEMDTATGEPAQGAPGVSLKRGEKVDYLYKAWRNKKEQTSTTMSIYDDAGATVDHKSTVSDDANKATMGEFIAGP